MQKPNVVYAFMNKQYLVVIQHVSLTILLLSQFFRLCRSGDVSAIRSLLQEAVAQAGVNEVAGPNNFAPLHEAAAAGNADIIQFLATEVEGLDVDVYTHGPPSFTPLHLAAQQGHTEAVIALIESGASLDIVDRYCRTPKDLASERKKRDVVHIINVYGKYIV